MTREVRYSPLGNLAFEVNILKSGFSKYTLPQCCHNTYCTAHRSRVASLPAGSESGTLAGEESDEPRMAGNESSASLHANQFKAAPGV